MVNTISISVDPDSAELVLDILDTQQEYLISLRDEHELRLLKAAVEILLKKEA
jgi:hypothetical protein